MSCCVVLCSVRETLSSYEDPTVMYQLQRELAVKEERFEDARQFQQHILHEMTHNRWATGRLGLVVPCAALHTAVGS